MSSFASFALQPGESVTAFELGALEERYFPGPVETGVDRVDYCFVNGFVDVGDLPCRKATWEEIEARPTPALADFETEEITLPGFSRRLDFSGFWHIPHRLSRWCRTRLLAPSDGPQRFRLATCGGVNVWVDGQHVAEFAPFSRNRVQEIELELPLKVGGSEVVLLMEEMAERDTRFFVELTWAGAGTLGCEVSSAADPEVLPALMALARDVRPKAVCFGAGAALTLVFGAPPALDVTVAAEVRQSVHLKHKPPLLAREAVLRSGQNEVDLGDPAPAGDGYHPLHLTISVGAARVRREIAYARLETPVPEALPDTLAARKALALRYAAEHGEARTGRLLAMMALRMPFDALGKDILEDTLDGVRQRRDCSDFVLVPLLWLMTRYGDKLPEAEAKAAASAILGYRYWMDEPGNDAMWFWSENHVLCFHVSAYLAGRLYPLARFENSGLSGQAQLALAERKLERWLTSIEAHGLAEWNSAAYYPIDFIGLFALAELGEGQIRARARGLLDTLFEMIALHTAGGVSAGTMGRAYDKELRAGPLTELSPFAAVAFGSGWLNSGVAALPMFCLSDYAPPQGLAPLARPGPDHEIRAHYVQGYGTQARLALTKTAHMQLSASIDAVPGARGHQQHLVDVQSASAPFARVWVNHPGEDDPWGEGRPSYWAGNGMMPRVGMVGDTCLMLFDCAADPVLPFSHAYAPLSEFDAFHIGGDFAVLASGGGAVILKANGPIEAVTEGPGAGIELRCGGLRTGWAIQICDLPDAGIEALVAEAASARLRIADAGPALTLERDGREALSLDYGSGLWVDGQAHPFPTDSHRPNVGIFPKNLKLLRT